MLELKQFSKTFKSKLIFNLADFTCKRGEIVLLIGRSGIGKTTCLDIISGIKRYDTGDFLFKNQKVETQNETKLSAFRNENIGYILQDFALIDSYTVLENILLPSLYSPKDKYNRHDLETKARNLAYEFDLTEMLNRKIKAISGGQKQRVAIIRSLILEPAIILADEPTTNLDKENFDLVMALFIKLKNEGKTVVIATHDERFFDIASKIYEIKNCRLIEK